MRGEKIEIKLSDRNFPDCPSDEQGNKDEGENVILFLKLFL